MPINKLRNPAALDPVSIKLLGNRAYFIPSGGGNVYVVGHMLEPDLSTERDTKDVFWAPYGPRTRAKQFTTGVTRTFTFQTQSSGDLIARALHAGDTDALARLLAAYAPDAWTATTTYAVGDYVVPAAANGYRYRATTGGESGAAAPAWPTVAGGTVVDGAVTWAAEADSAQPNLPGFAIRQVDGTLTGTFIIVWDSAEGDSVPGEVDIMPSVQLTGDGKPAGGDGENETLLGWSLAILEPANGYELPALGTLAPGIAEGVRVPGQVTLMNVPRADTDAIVNALLAQAEGGGTP